MNHNVVISRLREAWALDQLGFRMMDRSETARSLACESRLKVFTHMSIAADPDLRQLNHAKSLAIVVTSAHQQLLLRFGSCTLAASAFEGVLQETEM